MCEDEEVQDVKQILPEVNPEQLLELLSWKDKRDWTALDWCLKNKDAECIRTIIDHVIMTKDHIINTSAHFEIINLVFPYSVMASSKLAEKMLEEYPDKTTELLKAFTQYGKYTALHVACSPGHTKIAKTLVHLLQTCDPEAIEKVLLAQDEKGETALHEACAAGHTEIVKDILHTLQQCELEILQNALLMQDRKYFKTALHKPCEYGYTEIVKALVDSLQSCDQEVIQNVLLMQDGSKFFEDRHIENTEHGMTALHMACTSGHSEIAKTLLDLVEWRTIDGIKQVLLSQNKKGQTVLDLATSGKYGAMILLISLLAVRDTDTHTRLRILSYTRDTSEVNPFSEVDNKAWTFVLSHLVNSINTAEGEITRLEESIEQLEREDKWGPERAKEKELLGDNKERLKQYRSSLRYLPLIAAEKNKFGESLYDYDDLTSLLSDLLDICYKHNMDCGSSMLSDMFPSFRIKWEISKCNQTAPYQENVTKENGIKEQKNSKEVEGKENDVEKKKCTSGKKKQEKLLPYSKAAPIHPLTVIGESGNLAIIKHPYIRSEVDACWSYFARYIFYLNLSLFIFFVFLMIVFFTTHQSDNGELSSSVPVLTEISRYGAMVLALCGLIHEGMQISAKGWHYFKQIDLVLFLCTLLVIVITLIHSYNEHIHYIGCILITIAGIRAAWMFTHVNILGIGHGFRMLFSVLSKVVKFSPILMFFILIFAVVFHNLLQNQEPFSHMGFSIMRIMAMSVGEIDFTDTFFDESNVHTFGIVAFFILVIFLAIMTISMMNLLIGLAVPDVEALSKQGEKEEFKSKVDLILQYSYMVGWIDRVGKIQDRSLCEIYKWGTWQDISDIENKPIYLQDDEKLEKGKNNNQPIQDKFKEYMSDMEKEHKQYRVNSDAIVAVEEKVEKVAKQCDLEDLKVKMTNMKKDIQQLSQQMDQLIAQLNPKQTK